MNFGIIGAVILFVGVFGGWLLVRRRETEEKPIKIVFFAFYFWLLVFIQLALFSLVYYWMTHSGMNPVV